MRRREPLDPVVEAELAALDAALAGTADADAELAALVRDVRAVAPRPAAAARAALDARVASGFAPEAPRPTRPGGGDRLDPAASRPAPPRPRPRARRRRRRAARARGPRPGRSDASGEQRLVGGPPPPPASPRRSGGRGLERGSGRRRGIRRRRRARRSPPPPSLAPPAARAPAAPSPGRPRPPGRADRPPRPRRRAPTASTTVTDGVVRATQQAGGFVADSQIRRAGGRGTATFVLRIPAARLDTAIADLSRLAHVRAIEQGATDLTGRDRRHRRPPARRPDAPPRPRRRARDGVAAPAPRGCAGAWPTRGRASAASTARCAPFAPAPPTRPSTSPSRRPRARAPRPPRRAAGPRRTRGATRAGRSRSAPASLSSPRRRRCHSPLLGGVGPATAGALRRRRREAALDVV